jgi:hypothetical protein
MEYYDDTVNLLKPTDLNQQNALKKVQNLNRGYHKLTINILVNNKNKKVELGVYGSGSHDSPIRNAETGEYYKYKVGSMDEDLFFKFIIATGELSSGPLTLFYDSPEHCERHQEILLNNLTKRKWEAKRQSRLDVLAQLSKKSRL